MGKLKIFLSYHKDTPIYKSEVFQPIHVGAELSDFKLDYALKDNTGDNISKLNPYYCELTGHYWVLKNYLNVCDEDYVGFAHYRRLPDLTNITKEDFPAIYGMKYSDSVRFFEYLKSENLYDYCKRYDIVCPCTCYMYKNTVNPLLREDEQHYNVYDHFRAEHNNNCLDALKLAIEKFYPEYLEVLREYYSTDKAYFYNMYFMKKEILSVFLNWEFDVLAKVGEVLKEINEDYNDSDYKRMAGFVGECLINIWLLKHPDYKVGHTPVYMIDFEADYIEKVNSYHFEGKYREEIEELQNLLVITGDKFSVIRSLVQACYLAGEGELLGNYLNLAEEFAASAEEYYIVASLYAESGINDAEKICELFEEALSFEQKEKMIAKDYLKYTETLHDIDKTANAWKRMCEFDLNEKEKEKYSLFLKTYEMIKNYH